MPERSSIRPICCSTRRKNTTACPAFTIRMAMGRRAREFAMQFADSSRHNYSPTALFVVQIPTESTSESGHAPDNRSVMRISNLARDITVLLSRKVIGQDAAIRTIAPYVQMAQAGLAPDSRPLG